MPGLISTHVLPAPPGRDWCLSMLFPLLELLPALTAGVAEPWWCPPACCGFVGEGLIQLGAELCRTPQLQGDKCWCSAPALILPWGSVVSSLRAADQLPLISVFFIWGGCLCRRAKLPRAGSTWSSGRSPAAHLESPHQFSAPAAALPSLPLSAAELCTLGSPPFPSMPYKSLLLGLPAALLHSSSLVSSGPSRIAAAGAQQHPGGCSPSPWGAGCPAGVVLPQE